MAPRRSCGRPRRTWTHRQKRQFARLYTLTTLTNAEILLILKREGITLSERHFQTQLRSLYPKEYIDKLHDLRPKTNSMMISRLNTVRQYRSSRISKAIRYSRVKLGSKIASPSSSSGITNLEDTTGAFRNYDTTRTQDLKNYISQYHLQDSQLTKSTSVMLDGSAASGQTIMASPERPPPIPNCPCCWQLKISIPAEPTVQLKCGHICHERCLLEFLEWPLYSIPRTCPSCNAALVLDPTSGIAPDILKAIPQRKPSYEQVVERVDSTDISAKKALDEKDEPSDVNSMADIVYPVGQQKSAYNLESIGELLNNRPLSYIKHVFSVTRLSLTESDRTSSSLRRVASSLGWTASSRSSWMSISSRYSNSTNADSIRTPAHGSGEQERKELVYTNQKISLKANIAAIFKKGERELWNEIVAETRLLPVSESRPPNPEKEIFDRCCRGKPDDFDTSLCDYCGYAIGWYHWYPKTSDFKVVDSLGNTNLHYAAVSKGVDLNLFHLLIENGVDIRARNYSGETFMHVFKIKEFTWSQKFPGLLRILGILSNLGFPFAQRDFHGRTIAHSFYQDGWPLSFFSDEDMKMDFNSAGLHEILQILKIDMNALDNHGFNVGDEILQSVRDSGYRPGSQVMAQVEEAVARFRVKSRLKTTFQKSLTKLDWTPNRWLEWLQKENLITWIDTHGNTPLTALVKNRRSEDQQAALSGMIPELVKLGVDVNMRDRKGHTAIAIAAIRGSLPCVQALINSGASVTTENYRGRSISSVASERMELAKLEGNSQCHARILACINLLSDWEAKISNDGVTEKDLIE